MVSEWGVTVNWLHHPPSQRRQEGGIGTPAPLLVAAQRGRNRHPATPGWAVRGSDVASKLRTARGFALRGHIRPPDRSIANGARRGDLARRRRYCRGTARGVWARPGPREAGCLTLRSVTTRNRRGGSAERPQSTSRPAVCQRRQEGGFGARRGAAVDLTAHIFRLGRCARTVVVPKTRTLASGLACRLLKKFARGRCDRFRPGSCERRRQPPPRCRAAFRVPTFVWVKCMMLVP